MYAVILRAKAGTLDEDYQTTLKRMKSLAFERYQCREFFALMNGEDRVAISYWDSLEAINAWKADLEHQEAQQKAQAGWYRQYRVQVVEVLRDYSHGAV